jgi:hypothetical protein
MSGRAFTGAILGVVSLLGSLTLGLVMRQHAVAETPEAIYRTFLGYAMAAAAASFGAGIGSLIANSDRSRGEGEFAVSTALGIVSIIGLAMAITLSALYFAAPPPKHPRGQVDGMTVSLKY